MPVDWQTKIAPAGPQVMELRSRKRSWPKRTPFKVRSLYSTFSPPLIPTPPHENSPSPGPVVGCCRRCNWSGISVLPARNPRPYLLGEPPRATGLRHHREGVQLSSMICESGPEQGRGDKAAPTLPVCAPNITVGYWTGGVNRTMRLSRIVQGATTIWTRTARAFTATSCVTSMPTSNWRFSPSLKIKSLPCVC